ncbi:uncharacterized protein LOC133842148 isoform X1 [Drosophila sulfurigaster albostrigata]|uniref:uncharacterized protein LOC133842148 isoform X1 n=2 Tax=Drosophila sulfurigaster albostrigata TaxID=89887 RepID=UPI002D21ADCE|nr:uncharacterized protein LOC133842148 isoform X1 [Drosophila sulfurigaster albostrigata]
MPASSGLYRIKHGRVLRTLQKTSAFIFIAYIAACSTCGGTVAATTAPATAAATASEEASAMATATTMAPGQQEHSATSSLSLSSGSQSEALQRHINQNLIMSQALGLGSSFAAASAAALTAPEQRSTASLQSSSLSSGGSGSSASGSSITSFDSNNLIDDKRQHQQPHHELPQLHHQQQQQQQHSRIQAKDTAGPYPIPVHVENHLEATHGIDGADNVFGTPMYFGTENSTVVTTQIGATAHVPCTVHHIGEGVVSWIRKKDYHLLTVGLTTYSSDERFSATHLKHSEDWTLQIKFVQQRDAGVYECQVSTHPPTSIFLHLSVVEARAEISGPPIRYLTPGSTLRLQCRVVQNTEASEYIFWYHDNRMINYDIDRGINVSTEPDFQSSELTIQRTRREHSGNFTCVASNTQPASVLVHIFKGDNPAAMYHGHVGGSTKTTQRQLHNLMVLIAIGYRIFHTNVYIKIV